MVARGVSGRPRQTTPTLLEPGRDAVAKGDGVMFGEPIPPCALERCAEEAHEADVFMLIGATAVAYPAAEYPQMARHCGGPLTEVDPNPTALSEPATVVLRNQTGEALTQLVDAVHERHN